MSLHRHTESIASDLHYFPSTPGCSSFLPPTCQAATNIFRPVTSRTHLGISKLPIAGNRASHTWFGSRGPGSVQHGCPSWKPTTSEWGFPHKGDAVTNHAGKKLSLQSRFKFRLQFLNNSITSHWRILATSMKKENDPTFHILTNTWAMPFLLSLSCSRNC